MVRYASAHVVAGNPDKCTSKNDLVCVKIDRSGGDADRDNFSLLCFSSYLFCVLCLSLASSCWI